MNKKIVSNVIAPFAVCFLISLALYPATILNPEQYSTNGLELDFDAPKEIAMVEKKPEAISKKVFTPYLGISFQAFKEALAFKESQGKYRVVNTLGYLGKYQFGASTLERFKIYNTTSFLHNPELQEQVFIAYCKVNKWILRKDITRSVGKVMNGVKITESGILAAAHLSGAGNVKKYLRSNGLKNLSDAYGSSIKSYMKNFAGYDVSFIKGDRQASI